ncbi:hypothetical protein FO519_007357 [Halicephalobus sp. NKZ332]|nr:hypothetical protein FO519_007357 [Halicephalobus sp. NKZ332]
MTRRDNEHFLEELKKLFQIPKLGGSQSVSITMKPYDGRTKPVPEKPSDGHKHSVEHLCLFRAQCGSKKISTIVHAKEVNKFQLAYTQILVSYAENLKRNKKKPGKKNENVA